MVGCQLVAKAFRGSRVLEVMRWHRLDSGSRVGCREACRARRKMRVLPLVLDFILMY